MSDIKLFRLHEKQATPLTSHLAALEKDLQQLIEGQMEALLGVRFLASEHGTGKTDKGRINSLGLDENGCPVIIEYKRHNSESVISQGLFYLDWLLDHQAEFKWLVMEALGRDIADLIEWGGTRLVCIASDYNRYDEHAVAQINRNIELMRYRYFGDDLLLLELVNAQSGENNKASQPEPANNSAVSNVSKQASSSKISNYKTQQQHLALASTTLISYYNELCDYADQLGDEVQRKELKLYTAFKRIRTFAWIIVISTPANPRLQLYFNLPASRADSDEFCRDVSQVGRRATGDIEIVVRDLKEVAKAKALILEAYDAG